MKSWPLGTTKHGAANENGCQYQVVTQDEEELFASDFENTLLTNRDILSVYDLRNGKMKMGMVKQNLISFRVPLFEKETKKCAVMLKDEKLCDLRRCISLGDLQIETSEGKVRISIKSENNYSIYYGKRKIADVHKVPLKFKDFFKDAFADRYVIEYKEESDQEIAVMMTIALDVVNT